MQVKLRPLISGQKTTRHPVKSHIDDHIPNMSEMALYHEVPSTFDAIIERIRRLSLTWLLEVNPRKRKETTR